MSGQDPAACTTHLRIRIGDHEFEASGPVDVVQGQWEAFTALVQRLHHGNAHVNAIGDAYPHEIGESHTEISAVLDKVTRRNGRVVWLAVSPDSLDDEILLLLLGQHVLRGHHLVMGGELLQGLRQSGRTVHRIDYQLTRLREAGHVVTAGARRARRYRLSNAGMEKAERLARALMRPDP